MNHSVLEIRNGDYTLTLHPSPEAALAYATALAKETDAYTDEEIQQHLKHGRITEGDWEVRLITAKEIGEPETIESAKKNLFFVCEKRSVDNAWGIFRRAKSAAPTKPFKLAVIMYDYENTVRGASALAKEENCWDYSVQGATNCGNIPDAYES